MEILFCLLMGLLSYELAKSKGRDTFIWTILGLMFGFFTVIVLLFLPRKKVR